MVKTRPGIERITKQELRIAVATAKSFLDDHMSHCEQCAHAGSDVYDHCATWWRYMKSLHRMRRKLRRLEEPEIQGLDPLFEWPPQP